MVDGDCDPVRPRMVSEVISAPPELRAPVTMCSMMSPPQSTKKGITLPFLFPEDTPHLSPQPLRLKGGSPGSLHPGL